MIENHLAQLSCLKLACTRLKLSFSEEDENGNLVRVKAPGGSLFFANFATPFNTGGVEQICKDKEFTYRVLSHSVRMPRTVGYFDPFYRGGYQRFKRFHDTDAVAKEIAAGFPFPVIVKRNRGARGINVFLCHNESWVRDSLAKIFDSHSPDYDYLALAQEYIPPEAEYRAVVFGRKLLLLYLKDNRNAKFVGNLSPLHYEGARAVHVTDPVLIKRIEDFLAPAFGVLPIVFGAFDIILGKDGELWLLEINSRPGFFHFIRDNGEEGVVAMYVRMLSLG